MRGAAFLEELHRLKATATPFIIGNSFALSEGNQLLEKVTDFRMNHFNPFLMYN